MKIMSKFGLAVLLAGGMSLSAHALLITPTAPFWSGNQNDQPDVDAAIASYLGTSTELYKQNVGAGSDTGTLAGSYQTTFSNSPNDPADALIEYTGGDIVGPTAFLLVKDGKHEPGWYLFDLTARGWNGTEDLVLQGFWPNQGAISHVTLYGDQTPRLPDAGSTLLLLGLTLSGVEMLRRKLATR